MRESFGDVAAAAMADKGPLPGLRSLRLGGAYRLKDADLERLLACAPGLDQLRLPQCSLLQDAGCIPGFVQGSGVHISPTCKDSLTPKDSFTAPGRELLMM